MLSIAGVFGLRIGGLQCTTSDHQQEPLTATFVIVQVMHWTLASCRECRLGLYIRSRANMQTYEISLVIYCNS